MYVLTLDKDYLIVACLCGQRHTYYFGHGSCESKQGPFDLQSGDWIDFRFDSDYGNEGVVERITFTDGEFPDYHNVTVDQVVAKLNAELKNGTAYNDFNTVLVTSKSTGHESCVEVIGTSRPNLFGYDVRHDTFWHHCCNRLQLGFAPPALNDGSQRKHKNIIIWRKCRACNGQTSSMRNMKDESATPGSEYMEKQRKALNTLSMYLKQQGYVDYDMIDIFAQEQEDPVEIYPEFFSSNHIEVYTFEELCRNKPQS